MSGAGRANGNPPDGSVAAGTVLAEGKMIYRVISAIT
jgi:hypothetical protein